MEKDIISEIELLDLIEDAREDYKAGKFITAKSIADLV